MWEIHSFEFDCAANANFERCLQRAVEQNAIPVEHIISVSKRDAVPIAGVTESWVIVWKTKKADQFH